MISIFRSISHIRETDDAIQSVEDHLLEVKALAEKFGKKIGVKHIAGLAGILHDVGKYTEEFSNYIYKSVYDPKNAPPRGSVDHSTAGGKLLYELFYDRESDIFRKLLSELIGNVIISHHSYLQDFLNPEQMNSPFLKRVKQKELKGFEQTKKIFFQKVISKKDFYIYVKKAVNELKAFLNKTYSTDLEFQIMFLTKYIFSCLIDADRTNTRQFVEQSALPSTILQDTSNDLFNKYYQRLMIRLNKFKESKNNNLKINRLRSKMSEQCEEFADKPSDIYTLSIPTGGGKTFASFRYALKHAQKYNKHRIIYIVPYTTIIEQNAQDIRDIIKDDENLLEHHSNVLAEDVTGEEDIYSSKDNKKIMLAKDNWDSPIIFTTMVQFLNVFYDRKSRNIRRLHNLAESVIIFDEVQKVPTHCISLFNRAVNFLSSFAKSSILLCTATQPSLEYVEHQLNIHQENPEVISNLSNTLEAFRRVEIVDRTTSTKTNNKKLTQFIYKQMETKNSVLVILNTKSAVRNLYKKLKDRNENEFLLYHLSTSMCPAHRNDMLKKIREHLKDQDKLICVSTPLIEAGVDISFESVIRSLAGLDSIAQAAGRCNRHGESGLRQVYVIDHKEENLRNLKEIKRGKEITRKIFMDMKKDEKAHGGYLLSPQAMKFYFENFYRESRGEINYLIPDLITDMTTLLGGSREANEYIVAYQKRQKEKYPLVMANSYRTAAKYFKVIDNQTASFIVPYGKGEDYIAEFNSLDDIEELSLLLKKAQHYIVNLYDFEIDELKANDQIVPLMDGHILALREGAYDDKYGVEYKGDRPLDFNII